MAESRISRKTVVRLLVLLVLLAVAGAVIYVIFKTPMGARFRHNPRSLRVEFREWVEAHRLIAPLGFILLYVVVSLCWMPVWWLGVLAGFAFGILLGMVWSIIGATVAACCCFGVARTLLADYFQRKFETPVGVGRGRDRWHLKLRDLDEKLGHNGFMVVMVSRLMHFLPFGPSNYLFGVTRITWTEVAVGTFLGTIPSIALWVLPGAGIRMRDHWWIPALIGGLNVLLLVPILLRYLKPQWFKKIGVE
jgi:uncharacterized membrane protein YdjX (TVP38/TMEM64 family)